MSWSIILLFLLPIELYSSPCSFARSLQQPMFEVAFASPRSFGKTHFIYGHPNSEIVSKQPQSQQTSSHTQAFFSPDDDVKKELIQRIDQEKEAIKAAVFIITEKEIAQALMRAKERGVVVEIITDVGCLKERSNKISMLCDSGCRLYVYNPPTLRKWSSLMHNKFALFSSNQGSSLVWTGSYNFTNAASKSNQENAVVINDKIVFTQFEYQFKRLKNRSYRYGKKSKNT